MGTLGASTALALKREDPNARVCLIRGRARITASRDINKIIRAAYPDDDYVYYARQAMKSWATDRLLSEYFHWTSWVQVRGDDPNTNLHTSEGDERISIDDFVRTTGARPWLTNDKVLWLNKNIGYADSDLALEAVIQEASGLGVHVLEADISKLIIDESGACKGVEIESHNLMADKTVLATGAWTRKLLKDSNVKLFADPGREAAFLRVTAVAVAILELTAEEFEQLNELKDMPIVVTGKGIIVSTFLLEGSLS